MVKVREGGRAVQGTNCRTDWVLVLVRSMFVNFAFVEFTRKYAFI